MADDKVRIYKIVSKKMLEKMKTETDCSELLKQAQIEFLKNKESAKVVQNFFYKKTENDNQRLQDITKKFEQQSATAFISNRSYKKCEFCSSKILIKAYENHIENRCPQNPDTHKAAKKKESRNLLSYKTNREVQISTLANQLKQSPAKILFVFKSIGLKVSSEHDFVDEIFADSITLLFNPKKNSESPKNKKELGQNSNSLLNENSANKLCEEQPKKTQAVKYKICMYCLANIKIKNYDLHINNKCPKRKQSLNLSLSNKNKSFDNVIHSEDKVGQINLVVEKLSWQLLPEGEWLFSELTNHFRQLNTIPKWKNKPFDEERLRKIEKFLKPKKCYIGKDEFDGYVVYCFNWTQHILLECPVYGNAIYIIKQGKFTWQEIAKATKWEARTKYSSQVKVINHSETWLERLEQSLRYGL